MAAGAPAGSRPTFGGNKRPDDVAKQNAGKKNARQIESCWWRQAPFNEVLHGHGQADQRFTCPIYPAKGNCFFNQPFGRTFSPTSTSRRMSRNTNIAGFRLAVAGPVGVESQSIANSDSVRIYSRRLQFVDVQKHIRPAGVVCDKSEAAGGIPHFQFSGGHPISLSPSAP
jgi:hypothetical protein